MPTTIKIAGDAQGLLKGAAAALLLWFGGMAALVLFVEPPALIAFGPSAELSSAVIKTNASVLSLGRGFITARSDDAGLARRLYANGAWFVWPALPPSCGSK
jgi:hypothetical protein